MFEPGCFDDFEGTQEELTEVIAGITQLAENETIEDKVIILTIEDLDDDEIEEIKQLLLQCQIRPTLH